MTLSHKVTVSALLALVITLLTFILVQDQRVEASVDISHEYNATSTASSAIYGATITGDQPITATTSPRGGALGSVIITGAATGIWHLYDATTTNVDARSGNRATSTILLASFPASAAAGTYTFDLVYQQGLLLELTSGVMPTTTITWR